MPWRRAGTSSRLGWSRAKQPSAGWDSGIVAVASDNPALEAFPFDPVGRNLHSHLIALLGIPIGEMWDLSALAADCANDGRYTGLLTAAPLNVRGGVGSTANALALK